MRNNLSSKFALLAAASLVASPVAAASTTSAAPTLTGSYSPIVALSVLGSGVSAAALCGAVAASAAAQAPAGGCVLPAVDAPPPVAVVEPVAPPLAPAPIAVASSGGGFLLPLIGGLAALVGILALIGFGDGNPDGGDLEPTLPPNPPPISPQ